MSGKRNCDETARTTQPDREGKPLEPAGDEQVARRGRISEDTSSQASGAQDDERFDAG
ncbi:hypothetical protein [Glutamicibacter sp. NPDC087344]|uniref:hypothetical protein n=1 Tax=Glutamicibacter sp. NPDC087344 TaxID=3363994 RepID=UPI00380A9C48